MRYRRVVARSVERPCPHLEDPRPISSKSARGLRARGEVTGPASAPWQRRAPTPHLERVEPRSPSPGRCEPTPPSRCRYHRQACPLGGGPCSRQAGHPRRVGPLGQRPAVGSSLANSST